MDEGRAARLVYVSGAESELAPIFLILGRDYMSNVPSDEGDRFLRSILNRQGEPDRWLLLLEDGEEHVGFVHMKVDRDDRPGWGLIMEFYVRPDRRGSGLGRKMFALCRDVLLDRGVRGIWLTADPEAEPFWRAVGLEDTGEMDRRNGLKIMAKTMPCP